MKFKQFLLFTLCISIFACSSDSSPPPDDEEGTNDDSTLLKKIIYNKGTDDEYSETFSYDDNKLTSIDYGDGYTQNYIYENNKLVRINDFDNNVLGAFMILSYNSEEKLDNYIIHFELEDDHAEKRSFVYNSDKTITEIIYSGTYSSQTDLVRSTIITFEGENKISDKDGSSDESLYTYDNKNGMFKNVFAIDIINLISIDFGGLEYGNTNNLTSYTENFNGYSGKEIFNYTYNENGYPKTAISTYEANGIIDEDETDTIEYFYE